MTYRTQDLMQAAHTFLARQNTSLKQVTSIDTVSGGATGIVDVQYRLHGVSDEYTAYIRMSDLRNSMLGANAPTMIAESSGNRVNKKEWRKANGIPKRRTSARNKQPEDACACWKPQKISGCHAYVPKRRRPGQSVLTPQECFGNERVIKQMLDTSAEKAISALSLRHTPAPFCEFGGEISVEWKNRGRWRQDAYWICSKCDSRWGPSFVSSFMPMAVSVIGEMERMRKIMCESLRMDNQWWSDVKAEFKAPDGQMFTFPDRPITPTSFTEKFACSPPLWPVTIKGSVKI